MGWVTMSERDLQRIEVLTDVLAGRRTIAAAATVLAVSERQMYRLLARYEDGGGSAPIHKARGRTSNRSLNAGIRRYAVELVRTRYADVGPTLATEILLEKHDLRVGRETLRRWMVTDGLWLSRKQRRTFHQPRLRREHYGERSAMWARSSASTMTASRSSSNAAMFQRTSAASMSNSTTSLIGL
jgi:transposase